MLQPAFSSWLSAVMALWKCLLGCLFLASALNNGDAQPLPDSVYEQLTAQQLRELELGQNPELLDLAARTGERIVVDMADSEQGAAVQAGVNAVLDCTSWLQNFPGGIVTWYRFRYLDLEFTMLGMREEQDRGLLEMDAAGLRKIEGEYNEIYNITRVRIQAGEEDPHAGVYQCEVCVGGPSGSPFRECHTANTSLLTIGRPPILNDTRGRGEYNIEMGLSIFSLQIPFLQMEVYCYWCVYHIECADVLTFDLCASIAVHNLLCRKQDWVIKSCNVLHCVTLLAKGSYCLI